MISPAASDDTPRSLYSDSSTISPITSPTIFLHVLSFVPPTTLATCLRVSQSISHMAALVLYRDISLVKLLSPSTSSPPSIPNTRSLFWHYVRTLHLAPQTLYDPALHTCIARMTHLRTVVVPANWQGFISTPNLLPAIFAPHRAPLRILVKGLRSPAARINKGLLRSELLAHADEIVLSVDYRNLAYRGPRMTVPASGDGPRYSADLPKCIKRLTVLLPRELEVVDRRPRLRPGFEAGAKSGIIHTPHGLAVRDPLEQDQEPDSAPDLARVLVGTEQACEVVIVLSVPSNNGDGKVGDEELAEAEERMKALKERTELLVDCMLKSQGLGDERTRQRSEVKWILRPHWEGMESIRA